MKDFHTYPSQYDDLSSDQFWYDCCNNIGLNPYQDNVVLAVSGGADSMAMAHMIKRFWGQYPSLQNRPLKTLRALIIDHGIRENSHHEAVITAKRLSALGIPNRIERLKDKAPPTGVQAWAREKRYHALWQDACRDQAVIITGHHAQDQAETVLMRLSRGSGPRGMAGMRQSSYHYGVRVMRPFLNVPREKLHDYASQHKVGYVDDPSNDNPVFERVRWRQAEKDLQQQGISSKDLWRLSQGFLRLDQIMAGQMASRVNEIYGMTSFGVGWIDHDQWLDLPSLMQQQILSHLIRSSAGRQHPPSQRSICALQDWVETLPSKGKTLGGLEFTPKVNRFGQRMIWLYPEAERPWPDEGSKPGVLDQGHHIIDGRWHLFLPESAKLRPLGAKGYAALKKCLKINGKSNGKNREFDLESMTLAPARAFWRLPVVQPMVQPMGQVATKITHLDDEDYWIALEDGVIIPHVINTSDCLHSRQPLSGQDRQMNGFSIRFTGALGN